MTDESWFRAIAWTEALTIEELRAKRTRLPRMQGVYAFTNYAAPLEKNTGVLYIGKATSLYSRVQSYLVDPEKMLLLSTRSGTERLNSSLKHLGKMQLLMKIQQKSRYANPCGIWIRWTQSTTPLALEKKIIDYLQPAYNTQGIRRP